MNFIIHYKFLIQKYSITSARAYLQEFFACTDYTQIIAHILCKPNSYIFAHGDEILTLTQKIHLLDAITKRNSGQPLAYITGHKEFYGRDFHVTPNTLIPRPESEHIIEDILAVSEDSPLPTLILDIGTGSGNLIITAAKELKHKSSHHFYATDLSQKALDIAVQNALTHHLNDNISFVHADLLHDTLLQKSITQFCADYRKAHIILIANLPYVDIAWKKDLIMKPESQSLKYEPHMALWANDHGLALYKKLLLQTQQLHTTIPNALITSYYEINDEQNALLQKFLADHNVISPRIIPDLAGKARICTFTLPHQKK